MRGFSTFMGCLKSDCSDDLLTDISIWSYPSSANPNQQIAGIFQCLLTNHELHVAPVCDLICLDTVEIIEEWALSSTVSCPETHPGRGAGVQRVIYSKRDEPSEQSWVGVWCWHRAGVDPQGFASVLSCLPNGSIVKLFHGEIRGWKERFSRKEKSFAVILLPSSNEKTCLLCGAA